MSASRLKVEKSSTWSDQERQCIGADRNRRGKSASSSYSSHDDRSYTPPRPRNRNARPATHNGAKHGSSSPSPSNRNNHNKPLNPSSTLAPAFIPSQMFDTIMNWMFFQSQQNGDGNNNNGHSHKGEAVHNIPGVDPTQMMFDPCMNSQAFTHFTHMINHGMEFCRHSATWFANPSSAADAPNADAKQSPAPHARSIHFAESNNRDEKYAST